MLSGYRQDWIVSLLAWRGSVKSEEAFSSESGTCLAYPSSHFAEFRDEGYKSVPIQFSHLLRKPEEREKQQGTGDEEETCHLEGKSARLVHPLDRRDLLYYGECIMVVCPSFPWLYTILDIDSDDVGGGGDGAGERSEGESG
jgi:hypothetical protein